MPMSTSLAFDDLNGERPEKCRAELLDIQGLVCVKMTGGATRCVATFAEEVLLICQTVSCILGCALLIVCVLLPTIMMSLPWEVHRAYLRCFAGGVSLRWSSNTRFVCLGDRDPPYVSFGAWMLGVVLYMSLLILCSGESLGTTWPIAVVYETVFQLACVFSECVNVMRHRRTQAMCMKAAWAFLAGTALGAAPCMVVVPIYITVWQWKSTSEQPVVMILLVFVWALLQFLLKWIGTRIWRTASPAAPHLGHLLWILYVELILGLLGVGIFMSTVQSALAYSLSIVIVMAMNTIRGLHVWTSAPGTDVHMVQRVVLLLEMYVSSASKLCVFIVYLLHSSIEVAFGSVLVLREQAVRLTISGESRHVSSPFPIIIFQRLKTSGSFDIMVGMLCCAISVIITIFTWRMLPVVWKCEHTSQQHRVCPELLAAQLGRTTCSTTSHGSNDVETSARSNPSGGNHDRTDPSCGEKKVPRRSDTGSDWLPAGSDGTVTFTQIRLLQTFARANM